MSLTITSHLSTYQVNFYPTLAEIVPALHDPNCFYLVDQNVHRLYGETLKLPSDRTIQIEATEKNKSYGPTGDVLHRLIEMNIKKSSRLVVIGGGILQDIGAFCATVLFRGIRWTLVPTTLLAQADSCVGSKSSLNIGDYKNQLGTFNPPSEIHITTEVLATLDEKDIRSGIGEVIKIALVHSEKSYAHVLEVLKQDVTKNSVAMEQLVRRSLEIKKEYVEGDEFDQGVRNLLNYGHTFGHAFESVSNYTLPHGIAVVLGMEAATYFSMKKNWVSESHWNELRSEFSKWADKERRVLSSLDLGKILEKMKKDKKNSAQGVTFILTKGPGRMEKTAINEMDWIEKTLSEYLRLN